MPDLLCLLTSIKGTLKKTQRNKEEGGRADGIRDFKLHSSCITKTYKTPQQFTTKNSCRNKLMEGHNSFPYLNFSLLLIIAGRTKLPGRMATLAEQQSPLTQRHD